MPNEEQTGHKILLLSHGILSSTGFARVIYQIAIALRDDGHEIYVPNREYRGKPLVLEHATTLHGEDYDGITILGFGRDALGTDIVPWYIDRYGIDLVITLGDIWAYQYLKDIPSYGDWRWIAYFALDTNNMVDFWVDNIRSFDIPVVMSEFGQMLCDKYGLTVKHIPHAVDTDVFSPVDDEEKLRLRRKLNIPANSFVVLCVAHNQRRKMLDKTVDSFLLFSMDNADAELVMHTQMRGGPNDGWNFDRLLPTIGIADKVRFTNYNSKGIGDTMVTDETMCELYCAADVFLLLTGGEGFGIPFIESMACGTPVITTAYTTGPEIVADEATLTPSGGESDCGILVPLTAFHTHPTGGKWALADEVAASQALGYLCNNRDVLKSMGVNSRKRAVDKYELKKIQRLWVDLVNSIPLKHREPDDEYPFGCYTLREFDELKAKFSKPVVG